MADSIVLNGYTITLQRPVQCINNTQIWTYSVVRTGTPQNAISFWALGLEHTPPYVIKDTEPQAEFTDPVCLDTPPPDRPVVKWNIQNGDQFQSGTFSFTLQGCFTEMQRDVCLHAGGECFCGMITGPGCM